LWFLPDAGPSGHQEGKEQGQEKKQRTAGFQEAKSQGRAQASQEK
jgi:hypothetical protein